MSLLITLFILGLLSLVDMTLYGSTNKAYLVFIIFCLVDLKLTQISNDSCKSNKHDTKSR